MRKPALHWQIFFAIFLAVSLATILRSLAPDSRVTSAVVATSGFIGEIFLNALRMVIVPLIISSVITGIADVGGIQGFGRLGLKTIVFYILSSLIAILVGLSAVNLIEPGLENGEPNPAILAAFQAEQTRQFEQPDARIASAAEQDMRSVVDIFLRMFPVNVIQAATDNGQMLGLIVFSILFGIAMVQLPAATVASLHGAVRGVFEVMILITRGIMRFAPLGVFGLLLPVLAAAGFELVQKLALYFITVLLALLFHALVVLPAILALAGKVNPVLHFRAMASAILTAFSTASSSATLPVTLRCIRDNAGVSERTSGFVLPLGATVNMDGTALYECVAVIFVAQVMGIELSSGHQFIIVLLALLTSIGVAGIPSASLVAILIILQNTGIPGATAAVGVLLAVDRLLDMTRTAVNVLSDSCAAVVIAKSEGESGVLKQC